MSVRTKNVKCYFLIGSLEIIGEVEEENIDIIKMKNMLAFNVRRIPDPNDPDNVNKMQFSAQLVPPTIFAEVASSGVPLATIHKSTVMFEYEPNNEIYDQYCKTTSPILLAR